MGEFSLASRIRDVSALGERGRQLLWEHGHDLGEGFVDNRSQYVSLEEAGRDGCLRDPERLIQKLNQRRP